MAKEKNLIQGSVSTELKEKFDAQLEDQGFGVGRAVEAMVKLWVSVPYELQTILVRRTTTGQEFQEIIRQVVDERLSELVSVPRKARDSIYPSGAKVTIKIMTEEEQKAFDQLRALRDEDKKLSEAELHKRIQSIGKCLRGNRDRQTG